MIEVIGNPGEYRWTLISELGTMLVEDFQIHTTDRSAQLAAKAWKNKFHDLAGHIDSDRSYLF
jgi:hypothetical protein